MSFNKPEIYIINTPKYREYLQDHGSIIVLKPDVVINTRGKIAGKCTFCKITDLKPYERFSETHFSHPYDKKTCLASCIIVGFYCPECNKFAL